MSTISVQDIRQNPASFLDRVEAGEPITVVRDGQPVAEVRPIAPKRTGLRPYGLAKGAFTVPDNFNDPLPEDILRAFENSSIFPTENEGS